MSHNSYKLHNSSISYVRSLSIGVILAGFGSFISLPTLAQTAPGPTQAPGTTAPGTVAPDNQTPSNQAPGTIAPGTTSPGSTSPDATTPETVAPGAQTPTNTESQSLSTLLQQASGAGSFTTLARAVAAAGLADALEGQGGSYTIFAPTDEAFAALPAGTVERLLQPENRDLLTQVLAYHVVPQQLSSNQLSSGGVNTLGGGIAVRVTPERIIVNDGSVIQADIQAENGVVHAVNRVLLPETLRQQIQSLQ